MEERVVRRREMKIPMRMVKEKRKWKSLNRVPHSNRSLGITTG